MNPEIEERLNEDLKRLKNELVQIHSASIIFPTCCGSWFFMLTIVHIAINHPALAIFNAALTIFFGWQVWREMESFKTMLQKFF